MRNSAKTLVVGALIAIATATAIPATANAGKINIGIHVGHTHSSSGAAPWYPQDQWNARPRRHRDRHHSRHHNRRCSPPRALNKASKMGVHNPWIKRINNRKIVVAGYRWGHPVKIKFARQRHCPVINVRGF